MWLAGLLGLVRLVGELRVAKLVPQLTSQNLPIFDGKDQVIGRPSKMLADQLPIVGNCLNFHFFSFYHHVLIDVDAV